MNELQLKLADQINDKLTTAEQKAKEAKASLLEIANEGREVGHLLIELQSTTPIEDRHNIYQDTCDGVSMVGISTATARNLVKVARKYADPITDLKQAGQIYLWEQCPAFGLIEAPERESRPTKDKPTHYELLTSHIGKARGELNRWLSEDTPDKWDEVTRNQVKTHLRPFVELFRRL